MRTDILEKKELILKWISEKKSKGFICKELNCKQITLDSYLNKMNIDYKGNKNRVGYEINKHLQTTAIEYLTNSTHISSSRLRIKLIRDGIKKKECEICGLNEWLGQEINFELHHIDGNHNNNEFINLQILCPNCHSLTPNHGRNNR